MCSAHCSRRGHGDPVGLQAIEMHKIVGIDSLTIRPFRSNQVQGVVDHATHQSQLAAASDGGGVIGLGQLQNRQAFDEILLDEDACLGGLDPFWQWQRGEGCVAFGQGMSRTAPAVFALGILDKTGAGGLMVCKLIDHRCDQYRSVKAYLHRVMVPAAATWCTRDSRSPQMNSATSS